MLDAAASHIDGLVTDEAFYEDKVVAFIRGPGLPLLTLVDLPGLIHASNHQQAERDIETVKRIVESCMAVPSSIILAVLAADNNFANQIVLQLAKVADPECRRTLGIVTKPDRLAIGPPSEASCLDYIQNKHIYLDLGWHALINDALNGIYRREILTTTLASRGRLAGSTPGRETSSKNLRITCRRRATATVW